MQDEKYLEIFRSGALTESYWKTSDHGDSIGLYSDTRRHKKLAELFEDNYHCSSDFKAWSIYFNDGEISLSFKDSEKALDFVKLYGLKINLSEIEKSLLRLSEQKEKIEKFVDKIKASQRKNI